MKEVVVESNIVTVKYEENSYWAIFKSPVMAKEIGDDLKKTKITEKNLLNSPFKFRKV